jgi:hypothetical protein
MGKSSTLIIYVTVRFHKFRGDFKENIPFDSRTVMKSLHFGDREKTKGNVITSELAYLKDYALQEIDFLYGLPG